MFLLKTVVSSFLTFLLMMSMMIMLNSSRCLPDVFLSNECKKQINLTEDHGSLNTNPSKEREVGTSDIITKTEKFSFKNSLDLSRRQPRSVHLSKLLLKSVNQTRREMRSAHPSRQQMALVDPSERQLKLVDPCLKFGLGICQHNKDELIKLCNCDNLCKMYNDCCIDVPQNDSSDLPEVSNKEQAMFEHMSCEQITIPVIEDQLSNFGYHMVTKCPFNTSTTDDGRKCRQSTVYNIPVTDTNGIHYKNVYCALCHNVVQYKYWSIGFLYESCRQLDYTLIKETGMLERIEILRQNCKMYYVPLFALTIQHRSQFPRTCIIEDKRYYTNFSDRCEQYFNPVLIEGGILIRNYYCMKEDYPFSCYTRKNPYLDANLQNVLGYRYLPMTILFQIVPVTSNQGLLDKSTTTRMCQGKQTLTPKSLTGPTNLDFCSTETVLEYRLSYYIKFESDRVLFRQHFLRAYAMYMTSLPMRLFQFELLLNQGDKRCGRNIYNSSTVCCIVNVQFAVNVKRSLTPIQARDLDASARRMKFIYRESHANSSTSFFITNVRTDDEALCRLDSSGKLMNFFFDEVSFNTIYTAILDRESSVMNLNEVPDYSEINAEVTFNLKNNEVIYDEVNTIKFLHWFVNYSDSNRTDFSLSADSHLPSPLGQVIITYITMAFSTIFLIVTICMFVYFGLTKSLSGHLCMNLMLINMIANVIFMSGIGATDNGTLCTIIGVLLHYVWLSVFTWVTLYTYSVTTMVVKLKNNIAYDQEDGLSKKSVYIAGYGIPILIIVPCIVLDHMRYVDIEYNGSACFPTGYPANIIVFVTPVLLTLALNLCLLTIVLIALRKLSSESLQRNTDTYSYVITYIRLCSFSGFFWIFGILAQVFKYEILAYIFIIVCGSQGLIEWLKSWRTGRLS